MMMFFFDTHIQTRAYVLLWLVFVDNSQKKHYSKLAALVVMCVFVCEKKPASLFKRVDHIISFFFLFRTV